MTRRPSWRFVLCAVVAVVVGWMIAERQVYSAGSTSRIMGLPFGNDQNYNDAITLIDGNTCWQGHECAVQVAAVPFSQLPTVPNGSTRYCTNCLAGSSPCTSGGQGAFAFRIADTWVCGTSGGGGANPAGPDGAVQIKNSTLLADSGCTASAGDQTCQSMTTNCDRSTAGNCGDGLTDNQTVEPCEDAGLGITMVCAKGGRVFKRAGGGVDPSSQEGLYLSPSPGAYPVGDANGAHWTTDQYPECTTFQTPASPGGDGNYTSGRKLQYNRSTNQMSCTDDGDSFAVCFSTPEGTTLDASATAYWYGSTSHASAAHPPWFVPPFNGYIGPLVCRVDNSPGTNKSLAFTVMNLANATTQTCTISGSNVSCTSVASAPVPVGIGAGVGVNFRVVPTGTPTVTGGGGCCVRWQRVESNQTPTTTTSSNTTSTTTSSTTSTTGTAPTTSTTSSTSSTSTSSSTTSTTVAGQAAAPDWSSFALAIYRHEDSSTINVDKNDPLTLGGASANLTMIPGGGGGPAYTAIGGGEGTLQMDYTATLNDYETCNNLPSAPCNVLNVSNTITFGGIVTSRKQCSDTGASCVDASTCTSPATCDADFQRMRVISALGSDSGYAGIRANFNSLQAQGFECYIGARGAKQCSASASTNAGGACTDDANCGGSAGGTTFCAFLPVHATSAANVTAATEIPVACRYKIGNGIVRQPIDVFLNGASSNKGCVTDADCGNVLGSCASSVCKTEALVPVNSVSENFVKFTLSSNVASQDFNGMMDEQWVTNLALTDTAICRIARCGWNGKAGPGSADDCTCNGTAYVSSGRSLSCTLPACNLTSPPTVP